MNKQNKRVKVFCIGLGKTGTTSFGHAMRELGFNHMSGFITPGLALAKLGDYETIEKVLEPYDSFDDYPFGQIYEQLDGMFPGSLFVLTTRITADKWYESVCRFYEEHGVSTGWDNLSLLDLRWRLPTHHREYFIDFYEKHNQECRDFFKGSDRFLEVCWEKGDGWTEVTDFLKKHFILSPEFKLTGDNGEFVWAKNSKVYDPRDTVNRLLRRHQFGSAVGFVSKYTIDEDRALHRSHSVSRDELFLLVLDKIRAYAWKRHVRKLYVYSLTVNGVECRNIFHLLLRWVSVYLKAIVHRVKKVLG